MKNKISDIYILKQFADIGTKLAVMCIGHKKQPSCVAVTDKYIIVAALILFVQAIKMVVQPAAGADQGVIYYVLGIGQTIIVKSRGHYDDLYYCVFIICDTYYNDKDNIYFAISFYNCCRTIDFP